MIVRRLLFWSVLCACIPIGHLEARNLFVMPAGGATTTNVYNADSLLAAGSVSASPSGFIALYTPTGMKYYVVGSSTTDAIVVLNTSFVPLQRINLGQPPQSAARTPDGSRLLVGAGTALLVYSTSTDTQIGSGVDVGGSVTDIAVSLDSTRAFALVRSLQRVAAIDLTTNTLVGTYYVSSQPNAVAIGPNGLLYVSADGRIQEVDPSTLTLRPGGDVSLVGAGSIGKVSFTPDGNYAIGPVLNPSVTGALLVRVDLRTHGTTTAVASGSLLGVALNRVLVTSNSRAYATSLGQKLYEIFVDPLSLSESVALGVSNSGVTAMAATDELPAIRYLFVAAQSRVYRIDLLVNQTSGSQGPFGYTPPALSVAGPPSSLPASSLLQYNNNQSVPLGGTSQPIIVRAIDAAGRPVYNQAVFFSPSVTGVTLTNYAIGTNADGFAQTSVIMSSPSSTTVTVTANISGGPSATFVFTVGGGTGVGLGIQIASGNGQLVSIFSPVTISPLTVVVRDQNGVPIPNVPVYWNLLSGAVVTALPTTTITDASGRTGLTVQVSNSGVAPFTPYVQSAIRATSSFGGSVDFYVTMLGTGLGPLGDQPQSNSTVNIFAPAGDTITGRLGETVTGAIQVVAYAQTGPPIPNVGLELSVNQDPTAGPTASCSTPSVLTNSSGFAQCDLVLGGLAGTTTLGVSVGGIGSTGRVFSLTLEVQPGVPSTIAIIQGNNQSGNPGERLTTTLIAEIRDRFGNPLRGVSVLWSLGTPGSATLSNTSSVSDASGRVSATVTLGATPGDVTVRVTAGTVSGTWTLRVNVTVNQVNKMAGDNQTAVINQSFAQALVVEVRDAQNQLLPNVPVTFAVTSGSATLGSPSPTTDAQGRASTTVQAGATAGAIVVTATAGTRSITFSLTSRPPGPVVAVSGFVNGADFRPGVAPGGAVTIRGGNIAPGIQGCASAGTLAGPLPTSLAGVSVSFGPHAAPIYAVCNVGGQEQVTVQAPFELAPGEVPVEIKMGTGSTVVSGVPVRAAQPGIFETTGPDGRTYAVVIHEDGTFVTANSAARRLEILRVYVTGLGPVLPLAATNRPGVGGQKVYFAVDIGINNAGVRVISAEYAENMIGVYVVTFEVPADAPTGPEVTLQIAVHLPDGQTMFGGGSRLAIQP